MIEKSWECLRLEVPTACSEELGACAYALGSCGLQVEEAGERARLSIYFVAGPELDMAVVMREFERHLAALDLVPPPMAAEEVVVRDWEAEWRRFFRPVWATPRIVIHPSWIPVATEGDQVAVTIDPQMAFGTGGHESTQLCLQAMECHVRVGMRCLDLGAGSGILSIAAVRLGAGSVLAVDTDAVAVDNARENIDRNGIAPERIEIRQGSLEAVSAGGFELVLANIQSHILLPLLVPLYEMVALGGVVLFSGLLVREGANFSARVAAAGFAVETTIEKGEWTCIVARRVD